MVQYQIKYITQNRKLGRRKAENEQTPWSITQKYITQNQEKKNWWAKNGNKNKENKQTPKSNKAKQK